MYPTTEFIRRRLTAAVLLSLLSAPVRGQTWTSAVSEMRLIDLPEVVDRGLAVPTGSIDSTALLFWNASQGQLVLATSDSARRVWSVRSIRATAPFRDLRIEDLDGDGRTELLLIDPPGRAIRVFSAWTSSDSLRLSYVIGTPVAPTRVLVYDVTSDRLPDLIVFDENEPGMQLLINRGAGRWQRGRPIAPDLPTRDAAVAFLNNDEIPDLIAYDWVRSEFHTLYGVGSGRFLDQGVFRSEATVDRILLADPRFDEPVRFLTVDRASGVVAYWSIDEAGELAERQRANVNGVIRSAAVTSSMAGAAAEFALLLPGGRSVRVEGPLHPGEALELIGVGIPERAAWAFPLRRPDRKPADLVVIAPDQLTAALLVRSRDLDASADSSWWSAGVRPEAVEASYLDNDERPELIVAGRGSRRLDILWSQTWSDRPGGVEVGLDAATVSGRRLDSVRIRFVTSHPGANAVAIHDLDRTDLSITTTTLPVQGTPEWAGEVLGDPVELAVLHGSANDVGVSLFEPIRPETYLEHTLGLASPSRLLGALLGDEDNDGRTDLVMVYKPDDTSNVAVGVAYGDSTMSMRRRSMLQEFSFRDAHRAWIWNGRMDGDTLNDILVVFPRTHQAMYVLPGRSERVPAPPVLVDSVVRIPSRRSITVADLDGDAIPDIVAHVPVRGGVGWWRGSDSTGYGPWSLLVSARDVGGIAVADVTGDGRNDLILTRPTWGAIGIYNGAALLRRDPMPEVP